MKISRSKWILIVSCIVFVIVAMGINTYRLGEQINYLQADITDKDCQIIKLEEELNSALESVSVCAECGKEDDNMKNDKSSGNLDDIFDEDTVLIMGDEAKDNDISFSRLEKMNEFEHQMEEAERKSLQEEYDYE